MNARTAAMSMRFLVSLGALVLLASVPGRAQEQYQKAPQAVRDVLDALPPPMLQVSPTNDHAAVIQFSPYPSIAELAQPMLRLAGHRINPQTNGPARTPRIVAIALTALDRPEPHTLSLPAGARPGFLSWSPDGKHLAFAAATDDGIQLWVADVDTARARRIGSIRLNACLGQALQWLPDSRTLLCRTVVADRGPPPTPPGVPAGPIIQESSGKKSPVRTFEDLLANRTDEDLFDYYFTAQLALVNAETGATTALGKPGIFEDSEVAPDGQHVLVARLHRPYSYLHPSAAFPKDVEVWNLRGDVVHRLASLPLADTVPIEGVPTGPRQYHWRSDQPATLVWVEALDEGDPKKKVPHRDRVLALKAPFDASPVELVRTGQRFQGMLWGEHGVALLSDYDRNRRHRRTFVMDPDHPEQKPRLLWDRSIRDRYGDPGTPVMKTLPTGHAALWQKDRTIYLTGLGASPEGDRPFLDRFDLATGKAERLFHCDRGTYEAVAGLVSDEGPRFLTRRESVQEPPNYFVRTAGHAERRAVTHYADPTPQLRAIKKELVRYKRPDGVPLSFTLYLPPDYKPGQRLPTIVWAYPLEFNDPGTAGQVTGSPYRFTTIGGVSHLFLLTQGYAVLDGATMPVVGDPETMNNTYVEQIVASARAAIDKAVEMGVADRNRVGVGGHSYGAFMTANLLAHSNLFRAGVARSGAYNRTLTPFGFQSERRTLWEAPQMYWRVSPFLYADKVRAPLLLIHGQADDNQGTFPIQSERMYQAVKGNGGKVRLVMLPLEAHGYLARESVEHTLWEMISWFDRYVKNAPSEPAPSAGQH